MRHKIDVPPWPKEDDNLESSVEATFRIYGRCNVTGKNDSWTGGRLHYGFLGTMYWAIDETSAYDICEATHWERIE